jgi:hypothetical protein
MGALEIREVNSSAAPSGAVDLAGETGGYRHRLISFRPSGPRISSSGYSIFENALAINRESNRELFQIARWPDWRSEASRRTMGFVIFRLHCPVAAGFAEGEAAKTSPRSSDKQTWP